MSAANITWDKVIKNALKMYMERDKYAYWYDIKGSILTDEAMDYIISIHPEHYARWSEPEIKALKAFSRGKIGYDCSGFIYAVSEGLVGGSADGIYASCPIKWQNDLENWAGTVVHRDGHIGLDIGYGYSLHLPLEGHTIEMVWNRAYDWKNAGTIRGVNYQYADAR